MLRWLFALVVAVIVSAFALLLITGQYVNDGPVLVTVSRGHGIHLGDLFIVSGWAAALLSELGLLVTSGRRSRRLTPASDAGSDGLTAR
ncbi:hypothetical protein GCU56_14305 [Geodermatophilus sabuli]|uniref:Uncharacterized protein n=1 Tax=Geodermatophilus sabuli TaxID=1564158 RepID=A0A7K3W2Y8_9ACTN|nr:hypothetical protein [Geodermatophilus sabuli]NEK59040.1 hypothetical protein [Geodermatophilus sabuli]